VLYARYEPTNFKFVHRDKYFDKIAPDRRPREIGLKFASSFSLCDRKFPNPCFDFNKWEGLGTVGVRKTKAGWWMSRQSIKNGTTTDWKIDFRWKSLRTDPP